MTTARKKPCSPNATEFATRATRGGAETRAGAVEVIREAYRPPGVESETNRRRLITLRSRLGNESGQVDVKGRDLYGTLEGAGRIGSRVHGVGEVVA
ncbi:hypothetical protein NDR87_14385 [Nocardia sp. CDC159]|uniref:Uncharacterized protein n=1 Tax=Nocardia pulmonis TaxID=2951408 RepID=A0A9X2E9N3_9NOCA|nr:MULTISPECIES: hypothetical protein [Nocardia]MCM6774391.1 hypothetical protein [Nocardia pulmonis]MCM6787543.1 hypothetical protein [Nocardia sp. CDC159]